MDKNQSLKNLIYVFLITFLKFNFGGIFSLLLSVVVQVWKFLLIR